MIDNINDALHANTHELVVRINDVNIKRAELGFVNTDCDYTRTMLATVCLHALENPIIFNNNRMREVVELVNKLGYGS